MLYLISVWGALCWRVLLGIVRIVLQGGIWTLIECFGVVVVNVVSVVPIRLWASIFL